MVDYVSLAATAERLINENGRDVNVIKLDTADDDPSKPWRGNATARSTPEYSVTGRAVFVPLSAVSASLGYEVDQASGIKRGDQVALFAANNDGGQDLTKADEIEDRSGNWRILSAQLLEPAGTKLIYFFEVER